MAAGAIQFPNLQVISESFAPVNGFINGCGQAATLMMTHIVSGQPVSATSLANLMKLSIVTGHAASTGSHVGSTTPSELQWLAEQQGVKTTLGSGNNWKSTVDTALPQGKPVVLGLGNAHALGGADANVAGHYVTVVGTTTDGRYIVADPNQPAAKSGAPVIYSSAQIAAAQPFATLTPVSASQQFTTAAAQRSGGSGQGQYSISLFPGNTTNLDPLVDALIRFSLITIGVTLLVIAVLIFTRADKQVEAAAPEAVKAAEVAAA